MNKLFMLVAFGAALLGRPADAGERKYRVRETEPYITHQSTDMVTHRDASPTWERHIWIRNPFRAAVWVYIECVEHLTINPIGIGKLHISEVVIPDIAPDESCLLHHWYLQDGKSPKQWSP